MTRTGRLIRQARTQEVAYRPCACGHEQRVHLARRPDDPRYRPLVFACRECDCERHASDFA